MRKARRWYEWVFATGLVTVQLKKQLKLLMKIHVKFAQEVTKLPMNKAWYNKVKQNL
jgi:hypothetical protein